MPVGLKRTIRRVIIALGVLLIGVAAILIAGQSPFPAATFEFQQYRELQGTLIGEPYPALEIPGQGVPWLLVVDRDDSGAAFRYVLQIGGRREI